MNQLTSVVGRVGLASLRGEQPQLEGLLPLLMAEAEPPEDHDSVLARGEAFILSL